MYSTWRVIFALFLLLLFATASLQAASFGLQGVNSPELLADVVFEYSSGLLTIHLTNTALTGDDPRLTAFAFNLPDCPAEACITGISSFSAENEEHVAVPGWDWLFAPDSINTPGQFGFFDVGAVTGPNFGGGSPNYGIPRESTYIFTIVFSGAGLGTFTDSSFLSRNSFDPSGPPQESQPYFIGRFQRGVSDVAVPMEIVIPPQEIPEPGTLLLLGGGLSALGLLRRRRP